MAPPIQTESRGTCLLTPAQVAERLRFTTRTVTDWLRSGQLPGLKISNRWRVNEEELRLVLDARARCLDEERARACAVVR